MVNNFNVIKPNDHTIVCLHIQYKFFSCWAKQLTCPAHCHIIVRIRGEQTVFPVEIDFRIYARNCGHAVQPLVIEVVCEQAAFLELSHRQGVLATVLGMVSARIARQTLYHLFHQHNGIVTGL